MIRGPGRLMVPVLLSTVLGCGDETVTGPSQTNAVVGSGNVVRETRPVAPFTGVNLEAVGDVHLVQGTGYALEIVADDNLLPLLISEVAGGGLRIHIDGNVSLRPTQTIDYFVTLQTLDAISLAGVGSFEGTDITATDVTVLVAGVGGVRLVNLQADELTVVMTGVGGMDVSGAVTTQSATLLGVGGYDAPGLVSVDATVLLAGTGSASVQVSGRLIGTITGTGDICYIGTPTLQSTITGHGSIATCPAP